MKQSFLCIMVLCTCLSCQSTGKEKTAVTYHEELTDTVMDILCAKMEETGALAAQAMVMEVQTGYLRAEVSLEADKEMTIVPGHMQRFNQPNPLMRGITVLAALETDRIHLTDTVDSGDGTLTTSDDQVLKDHNWYRGGYGKLTVMEGLAYGSNIATYQAYKRSFNSLDELIGDVTSMGMGQPVISGTDIQTGFVPYEEETFTGHDIALTTIGYNQSFTPLQLLTFYNALANNGKMVTPTTEETDIQVLRERIASPAGINQMKQALHYAITQGLGKPARPASVEAVGLGGTLEADDVNDLSENLENTEFAMAYVGWFPADNPRYTVIISLNKKGIPASAGLMAGDVFRQVADATWSLLGKQTAETLPE